MIKLVIAPGMAFVAGSITRKFNLNEFNTKRKNLMDISSNSIL